MSLTKREFLIGGVSFFAASVAGCRRQDGRSEQMPIAQDERGIITTPRLTFLPIAASTDDLVRVPHGYSVAILAPWGDPIGALEGSPAFREDASNSAAEQLLQLGMHHDGMSFFSLGEGHGLICVNHEYVDAALLLGVAFDATDPEHVAKCMHAHGVSIYETRREHGVWRVVTSPYARRITARTEMELTGPVRGHPLVQTAVDPLGEKVLGTFNNCSNGKTPWGTYLTCEENFNGYFKKTMPGQNEQRYGIASKTEMHDWSKVEPRFDLDQAPNEAHRFGWIVEIDPFDPSAAPKKRTALGRFKHENACVTEGKDGVVVYMGDDERHEHIYRFVSAGGDDPLDNGTLYAAKFNDDGSGEWLPLVFGVGPLVAPAFSDQAEVLVFARRAADAVGATKMDRPEWISRDPKTGDIYCSCTNNSKRTEPNGANPRVDNQHGHIIRWRDDGDRFLWELFVLAGDPDSLSEHLRGNIRGDVFSAPDGLAFDDDGFLWIMTDVSTSSLGKPGFTAFGNNQLLAVDPDDGEVKRFLTGPVGAEITGFAMAPDRRTLFVNVQHPGEPLVTSTGGPSDNDPADPMRYSSWPNGGRPRSATLVITRDDGDVIGR